MLKPVHCAPLLGLVYADNEAAGTFKVILLRLSPKLWELGFTVKVGGVVLREVTQLK